MASNSLKTASGFKVSFESGCFEDASAVVTAYCRSCDIEEPSIFGGHDLTPRGLPLPLHVVPLYQRQVRRHHDAVLRGRDRPGARVPALTLYSIQGPQGEEGRELLLLLRQSSDSYFVSLHSPRTSCRRRTDTCASRTSPSPSV